jgi:hypothetical protein
MYISSSPEQHATRSSRFRQQVMVNGQLRTPDALTPEGSVYGMHRIGAGLK